MTGWAELSPCGTAKRLLEEFVEQLRRDPWGSATATTHRVPYLDVRPLGLVGHRRYGLRPTPPNMSTSAGKLPLLSAGSGRHRGHDTTPGSRSSRPSKKPAICSGLRGWYGTAPLSL